MGTNRIMTIFLGLVVCGNLVLGGMLLEKLSGTAVGQTVNSAGAYTVATGQLQSKGNADCMYIWSHADKKLLVYYDSGSILELLHVRDCSNDFRLAPYGRQKPEVKKK